MRAKSIKDRLKYFDLPSQWVSRNWAVKLDADVKVWSELVNTATTDAKR